MKGCTKIEGGYYMKARKIQNSDISTCPPYVREIWDWLLKEVNHTDNGKFKRGQTCRTFYDIIDGLKWFIGYRKMTYSKSQCENAARWLRKQGMITTTKTTRGLIITICNYDYYQDPKNYDNNKETGTKATIKQQPCYTINKNDNKDNKDNKDNNTFDSFWKSYNVSRHSNKKYCEEYWNKLNDTQRKSIMDKLPDYLKSVTEEKYLKTTEYFFKNKKFEDGSFLNCIPIKQKKIIETKDAFGIHKIEVYE